MRRSEFIPVIPTQDLPYMHDLYAKHGLLGVNEAEVIMTAVNTSWGSNSNNVDRIEAAELLLGRRIPEQAIDALPFTLRQQVREPDDFSDLVQAVSRIADIEHA